jgi:hypothetical protein
MSQYLLIFRGFARSPAWCHVVVAHDDRGRNAVLVGELEDNAGTSVINATEQVAEAISQRLLHGSRDFVLYEYITNGLPELKPTFYRIDWRGQPGLFSMPTWTPIDPQTDPWLRSLRHQVKESDYTVNALTADRELEQIDAREPEALPWAM